MTTIGPLQLSVIGFDSSSVTSEIVVSAASETLGGELPPPIVGAERLLSLYLLAVNAQFYFFGKAFKTF